MDDTIVFNYNLKKLRESRGLTQQDLADELNISITSVQAYERGDRTPRVYFMAEIAKFFGVSMDELLYSKKNELPIGSR